MKRVLIGDIPHWEHEGIRLPIIAGGDHIPGHVGTGDTDTDSEFLSQFAGQTVFASGGQAFEVRAVKSGSITTYRLFPVEGGRQLSSVEMQGLTFIDNLSRVVRIGAAAGGGDYPVTTGSISEAALGRFLGISDSGGAGPSFASTQAAQSQAEQAARDAAALAFQNSQTTLTQQHENDLAILQQQLESASGLNAANIQAQIDLENLRHENDLAELALQFENQLKTSVIGEIGAERRTLIGEQGATRRQLLELGPDPFKQAATLSGQATRGFTPQQAAVGQAQQFINQPLPSIDFNATLPQLQSQLGNIQGTQAPSLTGGFGLPSLAHGGVIEMEQKDGAFSMKPTGKQTFLVGDGAGIIPGITEALTIGDGKIEVTPFAGGAQGGLSLQLQSALDAFQQQGLQQSSLQALQPLFQGLGFDQIPTARSKFGPGQVITSPLSRLETLSTLGVRPNLVRDATSGIFYLVSPEGIKHIGNQTATIMAGFDIEQAVNLSRNELLSFGIGSGGVFGREPETLPTGPTPAFQALGTPLIEPTTGAILPAPFKQASRLGQFSRERPDLFNNALSAFRSAGLDPSSVIAQIEAATPTGRFEAPQRIGFTGSRI